jgi:hypothetical protein
LPYCRNTSGSEGVIDFVGPFVLEVSATDHRHSLPLVSIIGRENQPTKFPGDPGDGRKISVS